MPNPKLPDKRPPEARTLRDLVEDKLLLFVECEKCLVLRRLDYLDLAHKVGPDVPIGNFTRRFVCTRCGARRAAPLISEQLGRRIINWTPREPRGTR